jgi:CRP-like cAMP-binding protein
MPVRERAASSNLLVASLPAKDREQLLAICEQVDLQFGVVLVEAGHPITDVYFPVDCFISLVNSVDDKATIEVGLVGREGMFGESLALGVANSPLTAVVQGAGPALRLDAAAFVREHGRNAGLERVVGRYLYVSLKQIAQAASCTRYHLVEARLARWLLMTQDRAGGPRFHVTHKFLAWMLGVRRAGVTMAALALQARNLITYQRGDVTVLSRAGLEAAACPCYRAQNITYECVMGGGAKRTSRAAQPAAPA